MKLEAEAHIKRAERSLKSSVFLLEKGMCEDAASRAYYCVFHAAKAVLASTFSLFSTTFETHV